MSRRHFLVASGAAVLLGSTTASGIAIASSTELNLAQVIYGGGNWQPRPTALRRLAWELQRRTAVNARLEPVAIRITPDNLANNPLLYFSGDRAFPPLPKEEIGWLNRYLKLGGTIIVDPAYDRNADPDGFLTSIHTLFSAALPDISKKNIHPDHLLYRTFYRLNRPAGRHKGSDTLTGYPVGNRIAVIIGDHDMGAAWARDNLGNWEYDIPKGGARQREHAFRTGINLVMYALCGNYKNETPHKRFGQRTTVTK